MEMNQEVLAYMHVEVDLIMSDDMDVLAI